MELSIVIYKIFCKDESITDIYIGQTKNFHSRQIDHRKVCNSLSYKISNLPLYKYMRLHGGWDNWNMEIIDTLVCTRNFAKKKEREYIEILNATLNKQIPTRDKSEYRFVFKDDLSTKHKEYAINNKEKISEYQKQYYEKNKQRLIEYAKNNRINKKQIK